MKIVDQYGQRNDEVGSISTFFATNPELMTADRYAPVEVVPASHFFADNPELMAAQRYTAVTTK